MEEREVIAELILEDELGARRQRPVSADEHARRRETLRHLPDELVEQLEADLDGSPAGRVLLRLALVGLLPGGGKPPEDELAHQLELLLVEIDEAQAEHEVGGPPEVALALDVDHLGGHLDAGLRQISLRLHHEVQTLEDRALFEPLFAQQRRPAGAQGPDRALAPLLLAGDQVFGLQRDAEPRMLAALLDHGSGG